MFINGGSNFLENRKYLSFQFFFSFNWRHNPSTSRQFSFCLLGICPALMCHGHTLFRQVSIYAIISYQLSMKFSKIIVERAHFLDLFTLAIWICIDQTPIYVFWLFEWYRCPQIFASRKFFQDFSHAGLNSVWLHSHAPTHPSIYLVVLLSRVQNFSWRVNFTPTLLSVLSYPFANN